MVGEIAAYLTRPHPEDHDVLRDYLGPYDAEPAAPILHDLLDPRIGHGLDDVLDQVLHHAAVPPHELSLRRCLSYVDNLDRFLRTDANIYGWGTE